MTENSKFQISNSKVSVIIPAYNEEKNIEHTVRNVIKGVEGKFRDYEIIVFDDCSKDNTGKIVDALARENKRIKTVHNQINRGFAYNYKKGVEMASGDYIGMFPGDNEVEGDSVAAILGSAGKADIIIPYTANQYVRPMIRQIMSYSFTGAMNFIFFGYPKLKYFNGPVLHKKELIKSVRIKSDDFAFQAEALIKLIKSGSSYCQMPMYIIKKPLVSNIFRFKNVVGVAKTSLRLIGEIHFTNKNQWKI